MPSSILRTLLIFSSIIVLGILSGFCLGCRPALQSHFDVSKWRGEVLESGQTVEFQKVAAPGVILNVYSPTCVPCIAELPALHVLEAEARRQGLEMYMVADARPESHGLEIGDATPAEARAALRARLNADVKKYDIRIPLVIMDDTFRVEPRQGLVSGTPETMLFRTEPFTLAYNFVGPVAAVEAVEELAKDTRFQFVLKRVTALATVGGGDLKSEPAYQ